MKSNKEYAFIIPAYNPDEHLIELIDNIRKNSNLAIFIIDDGSKKDTQKFFKEIEDKNYKDVVILKHAINMGKGAALKTVFNYILVNYPNIKGVVTLDSDGQHSIKDCLRVLKVLETKNSSLVLGYRSFSRDIPLKSYIGNNISKFIYKIVLGRSFQDTQTGLRGLNREFMKECLKIKSNRFEFETEQLAIATQKNLDIDEIAIETIYIENNKASSFRPLVDSVKIYFVLFRYGITSIITALSDFIVFLIALSMGASIFWANMIARTVSIGVQYFLIGKYVFFSKATLKSFIIFSIYVYIMGIVSASTQVLLVKDFNTPVVPTKIIVEGLLFFVNFAFLRLFIFSNKR